MKCKKLNVRYISNAYMGGKGNDLYEAVSDSDQGKEGKEIDGQFFDCSARGL